MRIALSPSASGAGTAMRTPPFPHRTEGWEAGPEERPFPRMLVAPQPITIQVQLVEGPSEAF